MCQVTAYFKYQFTNVKEQKRAREPRPYDCRYILHKCQHTLGSVDISSQRGNEEDCTGARLLVGVGFPNPLCGAEISIVRLFIHNRTVEARSPRLVSGHRIFQISIHKRERAKAGEGTSPLRYRYILHKCQHTLGSVDISSQRGNEEGCIGARFLVGVGFPNPFVRGGNLYRQPIHSQPNRRGKVSSPCARSPHISNINSQTCKSRSRRGNLAPTIAGISYIIVNTP